VVDIYDSAVGYEIAFSYRDIPAEVDALVVMAGGVPGSVLELAAGPAEHAVECARRGMRAIALDRSPAMIARAGANAAAAGVEVDVVAGDMREFSVAYPVDLAFCMISSISCLLTLGDLVAHFGSVRRALAPGGCYVVEGTHPTDYLGVKSVQSGWDSARGSVAVRLEWGAEGDRIDPVTQVTPVRVSLTVADGDEVATYGSVEMDRFWTRDELDAAARLAGLRVAAWYGNFDLVPLTDPKAWRMIVVLRVG
jgi:SAM-dependent methyltransferase